MMGTWKGCSSLSLPGSSRQSMITVVTHSSQAVIMDARNKCGHDNEGKATGALP
jgi:hypothetical protein